MDGTSNKMTTFQIVSLIVFGVFILAGLIFFASYRGSSSESISEVTVWGTFDSRLVDSVLQSQSELDRRFQSVTYVEKDEDTFDQELVSALAAGTGPDLFFLPQDLILKEKDKIVSYPYSSFPKKNYTDTFIDEAQLFLSEEGILALPVVVDPLVLYWNKDMLSKYGFATPPVYWDEVFTMAEKMSIYDSSGTVSQSAIAFGEAQNILHFKEIMSMLVAQAGGAVTGVDSNGEVFSAIGRAVSNASEVPAVSALRFYTTFANPAENVYSWNRALPNSHDSFTQGNVGLYVGYASEFDLISRENPNLRFEVAAMPQIRDSNRYVTFGHLYAVAVPRTASNPQDAAIVASMLMESDASVALADALGISPVRRSSLSTQSDGAQIIFNQMALISYGWLDPDPDKTKEIFKVMIGSITSGSARLTDSVSLAARSIESLLK